jgi:hypothetical protein
MLLLRTWELTTAFEMYFILIFYFIVLYNTKNDRVLSIKFIDYNYIEGKNGKNLKNVVAACKRYNLYDLMGFHYG